MEQSPRKLQRVSGYSVHEQCSLETTDNEDHLFNGIMFDIEAKHDLPVEYLQIDSFWVRGGLGDIKIYSATTSHAEIFHDESLWTEIYSQKKKRSLHNFAELELTEPLMISPGQQNGIYIHSSSHSEGIVYDEEREKVSFENSFFKVYPGLASVSPIPFGPTDRYHGWQWPWRPRRVFVGKISYGIRYKLWRPVREVHNLFKGQFGECALETVKCLRNTVCKDVIYEVLNMLRFDWFDKECGNIYHNTVAQTGEPIGWHTRGDYSFYQMAILEHRTDFHKRMGVVVDPFGEWSDFTEEDDDDDYNDAEE